MATGMPWQPFGVMAPADVRDAGDDVWARTAGIPPLSSIVGGPGMPGDDSNLPYALTRSDWSRIVTNDASAGPLSGPGIGMLDDWRDMFNWKGSPVPWLVLFTLAIVGLMQFRLAVRAGGKRGVSASAGLG